MRGQSVLAEHIKQKEGSDMKVIKKDSDALCELTYDDVKLAIKYWLEEEKGITGNKMEIVSAGGHSTPFIRAKVIDVVFTSGWKP